MRSPIATAGSYSKTLRVRLAIAMANPHSVGSAIWESESGFASHASFRSIVTPIDPRQEIGKHPTISWHWAQCDREPQLK